MNKPNKPAGIKPETWATLESVWHLDPSTDVIWPEAVRDSQTAGRVAESPIIVVETLNDVAAVLEADGYPVAGPVAKLAELVRGRFVLILVGDDMGAAAVAAKFGPVLRVALEPTWARTIGTGPYHGLIQGAFHGDALAYLVNTLAQRITLTGSTAGTDSFPSPKSDSEENEFEFVSIEHLGTTEEPDWFLPNYIARGTITLISGLPKAGKTTFMSYLMRDLYTGRGLVPHAIDGPTGYLSEEPSSIWNERRTRLGLSPSIQMLRRKKFTRPTLQEWCRMMAFIAREVKERGMVLVIIDTLPSIWPVADENLAGQVLEALNPLREITEAGAAVVLVCHGRKSGGSEGTATRGSNALTGFVDTIVELHRTNTDGTPDRRRTLKGYGRFPSTPAEVVIELTDAGYVMLGEPATANHFDAMATIRGILPTGGPGLTWEEVKDKWPSDVKPGQTKLRDWLKRGQQEDRWAVSGAGVKGKPCRYYLVPPEDSFPPSKCDSEGNESGSPSVVLAGAIAGRPDEPNSGGRLSTIRKAEQR